MNAPITFFTGREGEKVGRDGGAAGLWRGIKNRCPAILSVFKVLIKFPCRIYVSFFCFHLPLSSKRR